MFKVSILDVEKTQPIFRDMAVSVVLPSEEGELSVLDFHQPIVCCLKKGLVKIDEKKPIPVKRGIAMMKSSELVVLVKR